MSDLGRCGCSGPSRNYLHSRVREMVMVSNWISLVSLATTINQSLHAAQCVASNTLSEVMVDLLVVSLLPIKPASRVDSEAKRKAP
jgi:hypothetical protein